MHFSVSVDIGSDPVELLFSNQLAIVFLSTLPFYVSGNTDVMANFDGTIYDKS